MSAYRDTLASYDPVVARHQRERELARMPTAPLETIGGFYAPAWAVGIIAGAAVCLPVLYHLGAFS